MGVKCPVCGNWFSERKPDIHISIHHKDASEAELIKIRDARREAREFYSNQKGKKKNAVLMNINKSDGTTYAGGLPSLGKKR